MDISPESLASWATIAGSALGILGLLQSYTWLTAVGTFLVVLSLIALLYARRQRRIIVSAGIRVSGRSIDSLNIASLRRRLNRTLIIQDAAHDAEIDGQDLTISWQYTGYCHANRENAIVLSVDTDNYVPFDQLDCFAYDFRNDPEKHHRIQPILLGPDGISKKLAIPFLEPLTAGQPFHMLFVCELPGCITDRIEYYTATMFFDQPKIRRFSTRLMFRNGRPRWVRAYDGDGAGIVRLSRDLPPIHQNQESAEYVDTAHDVPAQFVRIYVFQRTESKVGKRRERSRVA